MVLLLLGRADTASLLYLAVHFFGWIGGNTADMQDMGLAPCSRSGAVSPIDPSTHRSIERLLFPALATVT